MDPSVALLILLAGIAVGFINNLAGAAGAIGLVAFEVLVGMSPMEANAALRPSALAIGLAGFLGYVSKRQHIPARMWGYSMLTVPGAVLGSVLVDDRFELLFQLTLVVLLALVLVQQVRNGNVAIAPGPRTKPAAWLVLLLFTWLGAHMGFIQVATGLVAIWVLSIVHSRDLVEVNAAKTTMVTVSAVASNATLVAQEKIFWGPALVLALGAGAGSFAASRWSVGRGHGAVRVVVIGICALVLLRLVWQLIAG